VTVLEDRYELIERLGRGGFGEVWRAHDSVLDRDVAVKLVTLDDDDLRRRFDREARALARLDHPNVVAVYDVGDGYLVMQLLAGPSLAALLADVGALPLEQALDYTRQAASGLAAAHAAGIVHRDVSPSNLILDGAGTLKLVDFGVARLDGTSGLTATGTVFATAGYVSPEQAEGRPADARSDLYSLGCVMYALLTGAPPFTGEHPIGVIQQHLTATPPPLHVRPDVDALVAELLAKDPRDRPGSADAVVRRLSGETAEPTIALPRARRRRPTVLMAALAAGLVVLGIFLATTLGSGGGSKAGTTAAAPPPTTTQPPPPTTTAPKPTPPQPTTPADAIAAVRRAIAAAQSGGQLDPGAANDLEHRLDDISQALTHPNPNDTAHKAADLVHQIGNLQQNGQLTGGTALQTAVQRLVALLPTAPAPPGHGKKKGDGND